MPSNPKPFTNMETAAFCDQIALILHSGISTLEGITMMLEDCESPAEKEILQVILGKLSYTGVFADALEEAKVFPAYMLTMVRIGEETGTLDQVMVSLSRHYEREESINRSVKSALTYPMVMAGMMVAVIIVLLVKVMPIFRRVFVQLGTEMTGFSGVLVGLGDAISRYAIVLIAILIVVVAGALIASRTESGRKIFQSLGYNLGLTRKMVENIAACRFAGAMALTLSAGLDPNRSLELASALNSDPVFAKQLTLCEEKLADGVDLTEALHESNIFTGTYSRMASIGGKTGTMDTVMSRIADLYQDEIDARLNNLLSILEPTLVIALSLIVGVILLSVMLPLMGIMSSI